MTHLRRTAAMAAMFLCCAASTAFADTHPTPDAPNASGAKMDKKADARIDDQAIVCKREDTTGSRLGATKTCHTRAEWSAMAAEAREQVNRIQTSPQTH